MRLIGTFCTLLSVAMILSGCSPDCIDNDVELQEKLFNSCMTERRGNKYAVSDCIQASREISCKKWSNE